MLIDNSKPKHNSTVLRQPIIETGRRLGAQHTSPAVTVDVVSQSTIEKNDAASMMASLRQNFSSQLATLEEEARQRGLKKAAEESVVVLHQLKEQMTAKWAEEEQKKRQLLAEEQKKLAALYQNIQNQKEKILTAMEPTVIELSFEIVAKILGKKAVERSVIAELAEQAIDRYRLKSLLKIYIARADFEYLAKQENHNELMSYYQIDEHASVGSCIIDFGTGSLDASLETQLKAIRDLLLQGRSCVEKF